MITDLKRVREKLQKNTRERNKEQLCRQQSQCRRRARRCSRLRSGDSPPAHGADHGEAGSRVPTDHGGLERSKDLPAVPGGIHARAGGCLRKAMSPWEACAGVGS